jgi:hypothetical protein
LDHDGIIPEQASALGHREEFMECILLPVLGEVVEMEFGHEGSERQGNDTITIGDDPIVNTGVHYSTNYERYLIVGNDLLVNEEVHATMFELVHHLRIT